MKVASTASVRNFEIVYYKYIIYFFSMQYSSEMKYIYINPFGLVHPEV